MFKYSKNPLAGLGNVDLILTGAWSRSLFPVKKTTGYLFDSGNTKSGDLIEKYGLDIMGLNQETFNDIQRNVYAPKLIKYIKSRL